MKTVSFLITTVLFCCYYHHYYRYHNSALSDDAGWDPKSAPRLMLPGNKSLLWPGDFGTSSAGMLSDRWHPRRVGLGQLVPVRSIQPHRLEIVVVAPDNDFAQLGGGPTTTTTPSPPAPVLAKLAASPGDLAALAREATMYRRLYDVGVTPRFLGHVTDEAQGGRIVGFLTEYIPPPPPPPSSNRGDKSSNKAEACLAALRRAHARGIAHGDAHGGNCLARGDGSGSAVLIDFELALETGAQAEFDRDLWIMAHTADD